MALSQRLDLRQTQSLVMTPQLQQAIKLLQLSNLELSGFIEQELERNPLLERDEGQRDERLPSSEPPLPDGGAVDRDIQPVLDLTPGQSEEPPMDADYSNEWDDDGPSFASDAQPSSSASLAGEADQGWSGDWGRGGRTDFETGGESALDQTPAPSETLREHLVSQLNVDVRDPVERAIGRYLIEQIDPSGYLFIDPAETAALLGCPEEKLQKVLERMKAFHPPGVFAATLAECLALQLKDKNRLDPAMEALLDHLELLARRDSQGLMRACGVDAEDLAEMMSEIRALDPKPGALFDYDPAQTLIPDVLMRANPDGGWIIELNPDTLPRILVNQRYFTKVSARAKNRDEKSYLSEQLQSASWLVKALHQRANTILKVAAEIVSQQEVFFEKGVQCLRPLVLRDIADAVSMHESTISRVTSNKYMATPRGVYELKYFFTQAIASAGGGEAHSAEAVRYQIKTLIDNEGDDEALSDDAIVASLRKSGVDIARRTVAKYREAMQIPSSVQRRREKKLKSRPL